MEKLISIVGLTSSGKSDLGIKLAKMLNGEIVSADSRQVYQGLDWCSGKVSQQEQAEVEHHLIDVAKLGEQFSLFDFQKKAYEAIDDIISRGKLPILVGGTGLYSRAVVEGYSLSEKQPDEALREKLEKFSVDELKQLAEKENIEFPTEITKRRLIRLIERGEAKIKNSPRYEVLQIAIRWSREEIYERIKKRLQFRMKNMIEEIKNLLSRGEDKNFLISLGLEAKYIIKFLDGEFSNYDEFFEELFKQERHFAKRQQTWLNKEKNLVWIDAHDDILKNSAKIIKKFLKNWHKVDFSLNF